MHGLVRELALQVYKTICNNICKLGNLLHSTREVVEYFFILCPRKQRRTSHRCSTSDSSQMLFHTAILGGEWTVMKISTKCNRCDLLQTMSELSAWPACCHTD